MQKGCSCNLIDQRMLAMQILVKPSLWRAWRALWHGLLQTYERKRWNFLFLFSFVLFSRLYRGFQRRKETFKTNLAFSYSSRILYRKISYHNISYFVSCMYISKYGEDAIYWNDVVSQLSICQRQTRRYFMSSNKSIDVQTFASLHT